MTDQVLRPSVDVGPAVARPHGQPASRRWPRRRGLRPERLIIAGVVVIIVYLVLTPLLYLLWETFVQDGRLTLDGFRAAYAGTGLAALVVNSLTFAIGSTALAVAVGTALAYLVARTDVPFKPVIVAAILVPLILPGILHTISWIFLASPRTGLLNQVLAALPGSLVVNVFSMVGMVFVEGMHSVPLVFLLMVAAFRSVDPSIEEAAMTSGASLPLIVRKITLPSVRPALLGVTLLIAIRSLEAFEVPALLGIPGRTWVFTSRIWSALRGFPLRLDEAGALALSLLLLTAVGVLIHHRMTRHPSDFESITGSAPRRVPIRLGKWRYVAVAMTGLYVLVAVVLPLAMLVYVATQPFYSVPSLGSIAGSTFDNFRYVFTGAETLRAMGNSILLGAGAATAVIALTLVAGWLVVRGRVRGRGAVDTVASVPLIIPGLVMGLALLTVYLRLPVPIFGTLWILLIAYMTKYLPYGMRSATGAMHQIGSDLEESAQVSGATWWQTMRFIHVPLLIPALIAGWIYIFIVSIRELSSSILLYSPGNEVLSVVIMNYWQSGQIPKLAALGVVMVVALALLTALGWRLGTRFGTEVS